MKEYRYKGFTIYKTSITLANTGRELYEIYDLKEAGHRPFLTSIAQCKEYINDCLKNYSVEAAMAYADWLNNWEERNIT